MVVLTLDLTEIVLEVDIFNVELVEETALELVITLLELKLDVFADELLV